jgi:CHAT domain
LTGLDPTDTSDHTPGGALELSRLCNNSALILVPDPDRSADPLAALDTDGTITAEQIARTCDLDADLIVLSVCQSGLGRLAGGTMLHTIGGSSGGRSRSYGAGIH